MKWGGLNAASVVGKIGAVTGLLHLEEMEKRAGEHVSVHIEEKVGIKRIIDNAIARLKSKP